LLRSAGSLLVTAAGAAALSLGVHIAEERTGIDELARRQASLDEVARDLQAVERAEAEREYEEQERESMVALPPGRLLESLGAALQEDERIVAFELSPGVFTATTRTARASEIARHLEALPGVTAVSFAAASEEPASATFRGVMGAAP
jgi:hypothetical protein